VIDLRSIPDRWRRLDVTVRDFPLGLLLAVASVAPGLRGHGTELGDLPDRPWDALALLVLALECLPLAVRRRWPLICLTLVSLGFALDQLRGYHTAASAALPLALHSAGAQRQSLVFLLSLGDLRDAVEQDFSADAADSGVGETPIVAGVALVGDAGKLVRA